MIRAGIIGGAGYTAGELIRLLLAHPQARIVFVHSTSNAGNRLADVHGGLEGAIEMRLSDASDLQAIGVLFLCGRRISATRAAGSSTGSPSGTATVSARHSASPTRAASPRRSSWHCSRSQRRDY